MHQGAYDGMVKELTKQRDEMTKERDDAQCELRKQLGKNSRAYTALGEANKARDALQTGLDEVTKTLKETTERVQATDEELKKVTEERDALRTQLNKVTETLKEATAPKSSTPETSAPERPTHVETVEDFVAKERSQRTTKVNRRSPWQVHFGEQVIELTGINAEKLNDRADKLKKFQAYHPQHHKAMVRRNTLVRGKGTFYHDLDTTDDVLSARLSKTEEPPVKVISYKGIKPEGAEFQHMVEIANAGPLFKKVRGNDGTPENTEFWEKKLGAPGVFNIALYDDTNTMVAFTSCARLKTIDGGFILCVNVLQADPGKQNQGCGNRLLVACRELVEACGTAGKRQCIYAQTVTATKRKEDPCLSGMIFWDRTNLSESVTCDEVFVSLQLATVDEYYFCESTDLDLKMWDLSQ